MSNVLLLSPAPIADIAASRGSGADNLLTFDPKEVWADSAVGSPATISIDLGAARPIDTICLVAVYGAAAAAEWTIAGGLAGHGEFAIHAGDLRPLGRPGLVPYVCHPLWHGEAVTARYVSIAVEQPGGEAALAIGRAVLGLGFMPAWNKEWGAGRRVIDTGSSMALPSGGFSNVEGARKGSYSWTQGDLTDAEVDQLYDLQLAHGETVPMLCVEDTDAIAGQAFRIHYGLFRSLKQFERRNPKQTRWDITMEEWV